MFTFDSIPSSTNKAEIFGNYRKNIAIFFHLFLLVRTSNIDIKYDVKSSNETL